MGVAALKDVYSYYDRLLNFFYQGRELISKERLGGRIKKTYDKAQTPFERATSSYDIQEEIKDEAVAL